MISSVSQAVLPHMWLASRSSALPSCTNRYTGLSDLPSNIIMSQPANLSSAPKNPPELEQAIAPVNGLLVITEYLPEVDAIVPVKGPVAMISLLSGPSASQVGSTSSVRYFEASPRWPRYSLAHCIFRASSVQLPCVRFTLSIFLVQDIAFSSSSKRLLRQWAGFLRPKPSSCHSRSSRNQHR